MPIIEKKKTDLDVLTLADMSLMMERNVWVGGKNKWVQIMDGWIQHKKNSWVDIFCSVLINAKKHILALN